MAKENLFASLPENLPGSKEEENQVNIPDELKGKSPEEIYQRLSEENQRLLSEQEKALKAQYFDESNKQTQGGQQGGQQNQQRYPQYNPQQHYVPAQSGGEEDQPDPYTEPEKFMDMQLNKRLNPLVNQTVQSFRGVARQNFRQQVGNEEYEKYKDEIESLMDSFSPQVQMNPEAYETAYHIVQANHLDEITSSRAEQLASEKLQKTLLNLGIDQEQLKQALGGEDQSGQQTQQTQQLQQSQNYQPQSSLFQRNIGVPVTESSKQGSVPFNGQNKGGKSKLTEDQKRMAKEFDMTEEEYAEWADLNTDIISTLGR